jgi:hypothetical protein
MEGKVHLYEIFIVCNAWFLWKIIKFLPKTLSFQIAFKEISSEKYGIMGPCFYCIYLKKACTNFDTSI